MIYARRVAFGLFVALLLTGVAAFAAGTDGTAPAPTADRPAVAETAQGDAPAEIVDATIPALGTTPEPEPQFCTGHACTSDYECQNYCGAAGGVCGFYDCPNVCFCFF